MTTPPLDLPAERLTALRDIANAATPGPWESRGYEVETVPEFDLHRFDVMSETVASCDLLKSDAAHIAAFDPPTVLALLDRVENTESERDHWDKMARRALIRAELAEARAEDAEAAERDLAAVTVSRDGWQARAEAAEKKVAAVREVHALDTHVCECGDTHGPYCKTCQYDYPCPTIKRLGGE